MANLSALASDENNTEFQGARDPDSLLHVRFYEKAIKNNFATEKEGRPIFDSIIFVEIHTPGNQLNIIDRPKFQQDEFRFPKQWQFYKNTHSEDPAKQGTPLNQWPILDVAKAEMLKAMKFFTVEQIAFSSDDQINGIGMLAGMNPLAFRDKAKAYLEVAHDSNAVSKAKDELKARDDKIAELEAKLNTLVDKLTQAPVPIVEPVISNDHPIKKKYIMTQEHKEKIKAAREAKRAQG